MSLLQAPAISDPDLKARNHIRQDRIRVHGSNLPGFTSLFKELPDDLIIFILTTILYLDRILIIYNK